MEEAEKIIRRAVTMNRKSMPDLDLLRKAAQEATEKKNTARKYTYLDLLKEWRLLKTTFCFSFAWFSCGLVYYVLSLGVEHLSGNLYLNLFLMSVVEIPTTLITTVLNNRLGRRWTSFLFFMVACVTAIVVVILTFISGERGFCVSVMVLVCKLGLAAAWPCIQVFTSESFPTVLRNVGYGTCTLAGRVGGIIAPYLVLLGSSHFGVLYIAVTVMMVVSAVSSLLCQETKGRPLPDTIEDFLRKAETDDPENRPEHARSVKE